MFILLIIVMAILNHKMTGSLHNYQAVVFAGGKGSRMTDLTSTIPKCLLPVANIPMIVYPLTMLQNANFTDVLILTSTKCSTDVKRILVQYNISLKLDFFDITDEEDLGTAEALRLALHKITKNVLLISCDFVCDFSLTKFLDWHELNDCTVSLLLSRTSIQGNAPGPKTKKKSERDIFALDSTSNRVAFMRGETDFEGDQLTLHHNLLLKFPRLDFTTKFVDCHAYLMDFRLLQLLKTLPEEFVSIKTDLLPFLIKIQHCTWDSIPKNVAHTFSDILKEGNEDCFQLRCCQYTLKNDDFTVCARLNNTGAYFETNKQVLKALPRLFPDSSMTPFVQTTPLPNAQVGSDSMVGAGTTSGKKTQIKRSVIGRHCIIGDNCRLNNSVVMDHVRIASGDRKSVV